MFARQALMRSCLLLIASLGVGSVVCAAEPLEDFPTSHCLRRHGPEEMSAECCQAYAAIELRQKKTAMEKAGVRFSRRQESDSPSIDIKIPDGDRHTRANPQFSLAGRGGGSIDTGRFLADVKGNQGDLLPTLLTCVGIPKDRAIGIATKRITESLANS